MLKKEQILKILKKYGFYSLNRAPYLYKDKDNWGIYFIWPNALYGQLERVLLFSDIEVLEDEVYRYWWFLNHKNIPEVVVEFDDYEKLDPKVIYKFKNNILSTEDMKHFDKNSKQFEDEDIILKKKQLLRTVSILISILQEKLRDQNNASINVLALQENFNKLTKTYNNKLHQYNKSNQNNLEAYEVLVDDTDESDKIVSQFYDEVSSLNTIDEIQLFITKIINYLKTIDLNEIHLQNVYLLKRYPIEIDDIKKKIEILDNALKSKMKIFKSKKSITNMLEKIDQNSECNHFENVNLYIDKEKKLIIEKYESALQVDFVHLGDYLINNENLTNISLPPKIENPIFFKKYTDLEVVDILKKSYNHLSKNEKSAIHVTTSFLGECLNSLLEIDNLDTLKVEEIVSKLILKKQIYRFNESYHLLDNYLNAKLRVKYLSILKISSFDAFVESLVDVLHILNSIQMKLENTFDCFYTHKNKKILLLNFKNITYLNPSSSYQSHIQPNVPIYYSPIQIVKPLDILDNIELDVRENNVLFLMQYQVNIKTNPKFVKVVHYEKESVVKKEEVIIIRSMKVKNTCIFYEDNIFPKESE